MPVCGIIDSWNITEEVFREYGIPSSSNKALKDHLQGKQLEAFISDLNKIIGSSNVTCIEGG